MNKILTSLLLIGLLAFTTINYAEEGNKIIGWQKRIEEANGDEDSKKEINNLKYTISTQLEKSISEVKQCVADYNEKIKNNTSNLKELKNNIDNLLLRRLNIEKNLINFYHNAYFQYIPFIVL